MSSKLSALARETADDKRPTQLVDLAACRCGRLLVANGSDRTAQLVA